MEAVNGILIGSQLIFTIIAGLYFYTSLKSQQGQKQTLNLDSQKEIERLNKMRAVKLTEPLSEKARPKSFDEIIGQDKGIKALKGALFGANPQHVIIYGPPGVGKTAAARLVLNAARQTQGSPFGKEAPFIEVDATIMQFDERSIADPLIGSVHDPIYQGAGAYGAAGVPHPKQGAVTNAHGGILFIDEIGELHPIQMNKLLKVLEDRRVYLSSSYYSKENKSIPRYIHEVFTNGLPADFRLVGATTRRPEELPPALRSRCTEVFFRSLNYSEVYKIAENAVIKAAAQADARVCDLVSRYSTNGRDTVNIIQTALSYALLENRTLISVEDVEAVLETGNYAQNPNLKKAVDENAVGVANALAVFGPTNGAVLEIEALVQDSYSGGNLKVTGIIEEEEINAKSGRMKRISTARSSVENVLTALSQISGINLRSKDIHLNFPGGVPIDGPSAGVAIFISLYSALYNKQVRSKLAMTGEVTIMGRVAPVGGVSAKIEAAIEAGIERVLIPFANNTAAFSRYPIKIIGINNVRELIDEVFATSTGNL